MFVSRAWRSPDDDDSAFLLINDQQEVELSPSASLTHTYALTWTNSAALSYFPLCLINPTELLVSTSLVYKMLNPFLSFPLLSSVPPPRDSTIAVAIGASVGGALALLILSMVVVKCLRRHRKQELISEEKMEEEGKLEAEGVAEEGTK